MRKTILGLTLLGGIVAAATSAYAAGPGGCLGSYSGERTASAEGASPMPKTSSGENRS